MIIIRVSELDWLSMILSWPRIIFSEIILAGGIIILEGGIFFCRAVENYSTLQVWKRLFVNVGIIFWQVGKLFWQSRWENCFSRWGNYFGRWKINVAVGKIILAGEGINVAGGKIILAGENCFWHPVRAREFLNNGMWGVYSPGLVTTRRSMPCRPKAGYFLLMMMFVGMSTAFWPSGGCTIVKELRSWCVACHRSHNHNHCYFQLHAWWAISFFFIEKWCP